MDAPTLRVTPSLFTVSETSTMENLMPRIPPSGVLMPPLAFTRSIHSRSDRQLPMEWLFHFPFRVSSMPTLIWSVIPTGW